MRVPVSLLAAALLVLAVAAPAMAGKPARGCPNNGFDLMTYTQFRDLSLSLGIPEELLGEEHRAGWDAYNRNGDEYLCIKDVPNTPGHLDTWVFNAIDNTSNH